MPPVASVAFVRSRHARSFASLPEFTKLTVSMPSGIVARSRSPSSTTESNR
jgi:hypothetical protein